MTLPKVNPFTKKPTDLPDSPSPLYSAQEIKEHFQTPADELLTAHNKLVDDLEAPTGASALGAKDGATNSNVQAVLNSLNSKTADLFQTTDQLSQMDSDLENMIIDSNTRIETTEQNITTLQTNKADTTQITTLQNQVDALVVDGDSSPAIAQALAGSEFTTLKQKLDSTDTLLAENVQEISNVTNQMAKEYRYKDYNYDFSTKDNLTFKNVDGTDANAWTINSDMSITPVVTTNEPVVWMKERIQDGSISVVWENPDITIVNNTYIGIIFRGKDHKNGLIAVLSGGTAAPQVVSIYKYINGNRAFTVLSQTTMTTDDIKLKQGVPAQLQVEFDGKHVTISVNGKKVINRFTDASISEYNNGYCGLITGRDPSNTSSKLSNYTIKEKCFDKMPTKGINKLLFIGDSITYGVGASDINTTSWAKKLESRIKAFNPDLTTKNMGVSGQNTTEVLNNQVIPEMASANTYDAVIIQCGTNNGRIDGTKRTTHEVAIQDLSRMIKEIKSKGAIPVISTTTPYPHNISTLPTSYDNTSYWYNVKLAALIRQLAAKEKVRIVDNYKIFNNDYTLLSSDQLHPNDNGHQLIANNAFDVLFGNFTA